MPEFNPELKILVDWDDVGFVPPSSNYSVDANRLLDFPNYFSTGAPQINTNTTGQKYHVASYWQPNDGAPKTFIDYTDLGPYKWTVYDPNSVYFGIPTEYDSTVTKGIQLSASTTYTAGIWFWCGPKDWYFTRLKAWRASGPTATDGTLTTCDAGRWTWVSVTFTTGSTAADSIYYFEFDPFVAGTGTGTGETYHYVACPTLVQGSTGVQWPVLAAEPADMSDLSPWVAAADWSAGLSDEDDLLAGDGQMTITLNNSNREFSPENTDSPLFGKLGPNKRVTVMMYSPTRGFWTALWSGYTKTIEIDPFLTGSNQVRLVCSQQALNLRSTTFDFEIQTIKRAGELFDDILSRNQWRPSLNTIGVVLDHSIIGQNAVLPDDSMFFNSGERDQGQFTFNTVGDAWTNGMDTLTQPIKDVLNAEQGLMWVSRNGQLTFKDRAAYVPPPTADYTLDLDVDVMEAEYRYGHRIRNFVEATYYPKTTSTDVELWNSGTFTVTAGSTRVVYANLRRDDGSVQNVSTINPWGSAAPNSTYTTTEVGGSATDMTGQVTPRVRLLDDRIMVTLHNPFNFSVDFDITIRGSVIDWDSGITLRDSDPSSITQNLNIFGVAFDSPIVSNETNVSSIIKRILDLNKVAYGEFNSITLKTRDIEWLEQMLDITFGTVLSLSESQTGMSNVRHLVIGESWTWQPGIAEVRYTLMNIERYSGAT